MTDEARSTYRLVFDPDALDEWKALDGSIKKPFKKVLEKRLVQPFVPGAELGGELVGCFKIKLRKVGYRLVYTVDVTTGTLYVLAVGRRAASVAAEAAYEIATLRYQKREGSGEVTLHRRRER